MPAAIRPASAPYLLLLLLAVLVWALCTAIPAALPVWMPWDFSAFWFLGTGFAAISYVRGVRSLPLAERPPLWRHIAFALGLLAIYTVLQTHFEYLAQHMFYLNRLQHVVMHHLGPFLIALAWPWKPLRRGLPAMLVRMGEGRAVRRAFTIVQQPFLASFLFVGLVAFWLVPAVHFRAMIDPLLYQLMNFSMVFDGVLFWAVVLDPRPKEEAGIGFGTRAAMAVGVMFPQIVVGAIIAFADRDLYSFYAWCGRAFPDVGPIADQHYGGLIIWIPPAMMSALALILVLNHLRLAEEHAEGDAPSTIRGVSAADWTGRP